mgnify:CR=1 FL=1
MLSQDTLLRVARVYDEEKYPDDPYLECLEILRSARRVDEQLRFAVRCLFYWKLGKLSTKPTPSSTPLAYCDRQGRHYHCINMTRANRHAIAQAVATETLGAAMRFRDGLLPYEKLKLQAKGLTSSSIVLPAFYVHIWRPSEYPILDQNVWRVYCKEPGTKSVGGTRGPATWEDYEAYTAFFWAVVARTKLDWRTVDRALWVLGGSKGSCRRPKPSPVASRSAQARP